LDLLIPLTRKPTGNIHVPPRNYVVHPNEGAKTGRADSLGLNKCCLSYMWQSLLIRSSEQPESSPPLTTRRVAPGVHGVASPLAFKKTYTSSLIYVISQAPVSRGAECNVVRHKTLATFPDSFATDSLRKMSTKPKPDVKPQCAFPRSN
jgi:hypothetical protein